MNRRAQNSLAALFIAALATVAVAGCGGASATAVPTHGATPASAIATSSGAPSIAPSGSGVAASPTPTDEVLPLPHADAKLEATLPKELGGITLQTYSLSLSVYLGNVTGGDSVLYTPWLVSMGKISDQVTMAVATDATRTVNVIVQAFAVPGVTDAKILSAYGEAATSKGWPVESKTLVQKAGLSVTDPAPSGSLSVGFAYAKNGVLYVVVTDDGPTLVEALARLP
jgi:hypothetical protein